MPTLDVTTLLGSSLSDELRATSLLVLDGAVVVGTNRGSVLVFSQLNNNKRGSGIDAATNDCDSKNTEDVLPGVCVYAQTLHHGPVHSLCASTADLFASAGHDAAPVVQPITNLLTNGTERVHRLSGHTVPVAAMEFFSTGTWLATCSVGGRFIVFDTISRSMLCDVNVGFSVRCLALSPDETTCFVGGMQVARIDLYENDRPVEPLGRRDPPLWLQHYSWSCAGEKFIVEAPEDLFIARLSVTPDSLTAFFQPRDGSAIDSATATWYHSAADYWLSRNFERIAKGSHSQKEEEEEEEGEKKELPHLPFRKILLVEDSQTEKTEMEGNKKRKGSSMRLQVCNGWDTWPRPHVRVESQETLHISASAALLDKKLPEAADDSLEGRLAREEERGKALQAECDEIVHRLKTIMEQGSRKRTRQPPSS
ncbi:uncharacterized protein TM35_000101090 [Trypanosoma theileri]|uniref:Guanine nucleotide-binding protein subunit beta-like protein n=1 Tax=Trypanosoma theileri TaxID=67003 RepID=A0A1X0NZ25_9TRYP|nr:uncharacterized protein TM35_000101090 [Trypanosoma theileri]ORC89841.1 hypothetical protein TM35_000101090 [Trypanosoma theileri]